MAANKDGTLAYAPASQAGLAQRNEAGRVPVRALPDTVGMMAGALLGSPWEKLFPRTLALIDEISRYGGIKDPFSGHWRRKPC